MGDLASFLYALLQQWIALMSGIVSVLITIMLRVRGKEPRNKIFWSIAALCVVIAFFLAWRDEHAMRIKAQEDLTKAQQGFTAARDENAPRLTCHIEKILIGKGPDMEHTQVFMYTTIRNTRSTPSIADNYKLHFKAPDIEFSAGHADIGKEYTLSPADGTKKVTFLEADSLVKKTAEPINGGRKESGWLRFVMQLPEATPEFIRRPGMKFTVSLADVNGKTCSADYTIPK